MLLLLLLLLLLRPNESSELLLLKSQSLPQLLYLSGLKLRWRQSLVQSWTVLQKPEFLWPTLTLRQPQIQGRPRVLTEISGVGQGQGQGGAVLDNLQGGLGPGGHHHVLANFPRHYSARLLGNKIGKTDLATEIGKINGIFSWSRF